MPDKPLTVITYAASASLAAVALVYFFNPNYLIDGESSGASASTRKKGVVGLSNPANDCFINSILQSLAGLRELRLYLIRELHRRKLDSPDVYKTLPERSKDGKPVDARKILSIQSGEVTQGLKDILDSLNERPIYKKTISAAGFIAVLEHAFGTRISKAQQDAQELLQVVAERISDEYHAGREARRRARAAIEEAHSSTDIGLVSSSSLTPKDVDIRSTLAPDPLASAIKDGPQSDNTLLVEEESGFPLEGRTESQVECQHCHFMPKASPMSFVMLTLPVPQKASATLNECFDSHFKTEYIDDYKCDRCRLEHALSVFEKDLYRAKTTKEAQAVETKIVKVKAALEKDPETPPKDVELPDIKHAPKRRIARHIRITNFPNILVVHLSRSIYDARSSSTKNTAKVSFPERLPLGGLLHRRNYKLLGVVSHKGTHNSGHYETFRRQHIYPPTSTPHFDHETGPYSGSHTPNPSSGLSSPRKSVQSGSSSGHAMRSITDLASTSPVSSPHTLTTPTATATSPATSLSSLGSVPASYASTPLSSQSEYTPKAGTNIPIPMRDSFTSHPRADGNNPPIEQQDQDHRRGSSNSPIGKPKEDSATTTPKTLSSPKDITSAHHRQPQTKPRGRKKPHSDRWWRISDDKIKECKTADVLGMQKEVYILFYEVEKE